MATVEQGVGKRAGFRVGWSDLVLLFALVSSIVFIGLIALPQFGADKIASHSGHNALLFGHIGGGAVMLIAGAINLRIGLNRWAFRWHRSIGFTYLAGGTIASLSALVRSFDTGHTPGLSTGTLAVVWLAFSAMAWRAIRNRRFDEHRDWMIRSYVVAWTFVFCRFYTRAAPASIQGGESDMIWLTWVAPVLLCEVLLQWQRGARVSPKR